MTRPETLFTILNNSQFLTIKSHSSFGQTLKKIITSKNLDFVWVKKPQGQQMTAVLISRLIGKKFFWIQSFANPPKPGFLTRLLLGQSERIIITKKENFNNLTELGINKNKIKYHPKT